MSTSRKPSDLSLKEAADLVLQIRQSVFISLNLFIVVCLAIVGWLLTKEHDLQWQHKAFLTVSFFGFSILNTLSLRGTYKFLNVAANELKAIARQANFASAEDDAAGGFSPADVISALGYDRDQWLVSMITVIVSLSVIAFIVLDK